MRLVLAPASNKILERNAIVELQKPFVALGIPACNEEQQPIAGIIIEV